MYSVNSTAGIYFAKRTQVYLTLEIRIGCLQLSGWDLIRKPRDIFSDAENPRRLRFYFTTSTGHLALLADAAEQNAFDMRFDE